MSATEETEGKSFGFQKNYDELTGLKPGDSISSVQGVYDEMTGEAFILPPTEEDNSSDSLPTFETRSGSKSNKKAPVHVIYINGVNTTNKQYQDSLPLIEKLLEKTDIKDDYTLHKNTYNKSGKFDWLQSMKQGLVPGNFNDVEGSKFDENVVKKIKNIDLREKKKETVKITLVLSF